jgi:hypothetical protein
VLLHLWLLCGLSPPNAWGKDMEALSVCRGGQGTIECGAGSTFDSSGSCVPCETGTYRAIESSTCIACSPGSFAPTNGSSSCFACPAGTYLASSGGSACVNCPVNTYSRFPNSTSQSDCLPGYPSWMELTQPGTLTPSGRVFAGFAQSGDLLYLFGGTGFGEHCRHAHTLS